MILTRAILEEAKKWLGCREQGSNKGLCVEQIKTLYNAKNITRDAWCAEFVWAMSNEACKKLGVSNPLKHTASTTALLSDAKKTLRVDNKLSKGSVFYTSRTGGGHVGFVLSVSGTKFTTIEGNASGTEGDGVYSKERDTSKQSYTFIHVEDLDTIENNLFAPLSLSIYDPRVAVGTMIMGIGGLICYKIIKRSKSNGGRRSSRKFIA